MGLCQGELGLISATYELIYLQTSVDLVEDYLLSPEIYWSLRAKPRGGDPPYPMLTLAEFYRPGLRRNVGA